MRRTAVVAIAGMMTMTMTVTITMTMTMTIAMVMAIGAAMACERPSGRAGGGVPGGGLNVSLARNP